MRGKASRLRSILLLLSCCSFTVTLALPARATTGIASRWRIVPGARFGSVHARSTLQDLVRLYGRSNLIQKTLVAHNGRNVPGVVLFPKQPSRRVEIAWADPAGLRYPAWARVRGERGAWETPGGLALGTRLRDLERMNGRAFSLWGFDWAEGGWVRSWNRGNLADELKGQVAVVLTPGRRADLTSDEFRSVVGRRALPSGDPILRSLDPRISEITFYFPKRKGP
jgi:hypothetical protein